VLIKVNKKSKEKEESKLNKFLISIKLEMKPTCALLINCKFQERLIGL
jgi:hypothetical protein